MEQRKRWRAAFLVTSVVLASFVVLRRDSPEAMSRREVISVPGATRTHPNGGSYESSKEDGAPLPSMEGCKEAEAEERPSETNVFVSNSEELKTLIVASPLDRFLAESLRSLVRKALARESVVFPELWENLCGVPRGDAAAAPTPADSVRDLCWLLHPTVAFASLHNFVSGRDAVKLLTPPPYTEGDPASWIGNEQGALPPGKNRTAEETRYMKAELGVISTPHPSTFSTSAARLVSLKIYLSFAIRSVSSDERLQRALQSTSWSRSPSSRGSERLPRSGAQSPAPEARNIRRFLYGLVTQWMTTMIAIARSATPAEQRLVRRGTVAPGEGFRHGSPLLSRLLDNYGRLDHETTPCRLERAWFRAATSALRVSRPEDTSSGEPIVSIHESEPHRPQQEDLWAPFEPVIRCHSMWRECEHPDGCRFSCNTEYLLYAIPDDGSADHRKATPTAAALSPSTPSRYRHVFLGSGSNNDFMWESNLIRLFSSINQTTHPRATTTAAVTPAAQPSGEIERGLPHHSVRFLGTFDCTLRDSPCTDPLKRRTVCLQGRHWMPPAFLKSNGVDVDASWVQGSICLGSHPSAHVATLPDLREILRPAFQHGQEVILVDRTLPGHSKSLGGGGNGAMNDGAPSPRTPHSVTLGRDVRWFPLLSLDAVSRNTDPEASRLYRRDIFDDVSLLKIDIEEGEYRTLGQWLRAVVRGNDMFSVSQLQLEVHRTVSRVGSSAEIFSKAYWWMEYLRWELAALGLQLVSREKNYFGRRAYEWLLVHHTYFARSERWMELRAVH